MQVTCPKCEYTWDTKTKLHQVSCPSCGSKVKIKDLAGSEKIAS